MCRKKKNKVVMQREERARNTERSSNLLEAVATSLESRWLNFRDFEPVVKLLVA